MPPMKSVGSRQSNIHLMCDTPFTLDPQPHGRSEAEQKAEYETYITSLKLSMIEQLSGKRIFEEVNWSDKVCLHESQIKSLLIYRC